MVKRTVAECDAILCGKGMPHETETRLVDGQIQRVYKNLWPSVRVFWLASAAQHKDNDYLVYEGTRLTYEAAFEQSLKIATVFHHTYGIKKGDRVAICARNLPQYLVSFWACQLLGAVGVLVNAWLPSDPLIHCITHTGCKVALFDYERAKRVAPELQKLQAQGVSKFVILDAPNNAPVLQGFELFQHILSSGGPPPKDILAYDPHILPEDNASIIFTSGTTGLPKGVLSTQRQFLTNILNSTISQARSALREGQVPTPPVPGAGRGLLLSVPFFHVTGLNSLTLLATASGMKIILIRKWNAKEAVRLIQTENVKAAGGVPSMATDLVESGLAKNTLETLLFGGAAAPEMLPKKAKSKFPDIRLAQGYGLTETNSIVTGITGPDYDERPKSIGLPCPVNDIVIVQDGVVVPPGIIGEIWIRGPNVMKCYWGDEAATAKALTRDGWFLSGDVGEIDSDGFIYIRDRIKDMIIRGGENIASVSVEGALHYDDRVSQVAAVAVPDAKLGELVTAVVSTKPEYKGQVKESELIEVAKKRLPRFAVPVMVIVQDEQLELTPSGKIVKAPLRDIAAKEWERRKATQNIKAKL